MFYELFKIYIYFKVLNNLVCNKKWMSGEGREGWRGDLWKGDG
jgi:hypothetical protein